MKGHNPSLADGMSTTLYAEKSKRLMELDRKLRDLGAGSDFDLPKIAVIGGQSAGKSSLVEAVTGIRVPRDSGTCTRCPMECTIKGVPGSDWSCQVSLRFEYDDKADMQSHTTRKVTFGHTLYDPSEVELVLRQAQMAILNPTSVSESFLNLTQEQLSAFHPSFQTSDALRFSRNVISMEITTPDSASLAFVDLPGLIANDDDDTVRFVENLARSSIMGDCIILVTIPMTEDMDMHRAARLAKEADPDKNRTIGVLTKPDMLTTGSISAHDNWKQVLQGRKDVLKHGYYCVRLPDDEERGLCLRRPETQLREQAFFAETPPWSGFADRTRFGIPSLVNDLSKHLAKLIDKALPTLKHDVQNQLRICKDKLRKLPEPPKVDPVMEVLSLTSKFCKDIHGIVNGSLHGSIEHHGFIQQNRATYEIFKNSIRQTAPDFRPFRSVEGYYAVQDDGDGLSPCTRPNSLSTPLSLYDIRRIIKESISWELPHNVPFSAKKRLIHEFIDLWADPAISCFEDVVERLQDILFAKINARFSQYPALKEVVMKTVTELLTSIKGTARSAVFNILNLEKMPLFTQNLHYLDSVRKQWLSRYSSARDNSHNFVRPVVHFEDPESPLPVPMPPIEDSWTEPAHNPSPLDKALRVLAEHGYGGLSASDFARLSPSESFEDELVVMADVRAYFQVAYKRVIDYIPLTIEHSLNQTMADSIQRALLLVVDVGSSDASERLGGLLAEDPAIAAQRAEYQSRMRRLQAIDAELRRFGV